MILLIPSLEGAESRRHDLYCESILEDGSLPGEAWTVDGAGLAMIEERLSPQVFEPVLWAGLAAYGLAVGLAGRKKGGE